MKPTRLLGRVDMAGGIAAVRVPPAVACHLGRVASAPVEPTTTASPVQLGIDGFCKSPPQSPRQDVTMKEKKQKEEEQRANSRSPRRGETNEDAAKVRLDAAAATQLPAAAKDTVILVEEEGEKLTAGASSDSPLGDAKTASLVP